MKNHDKLMNNFIGPYKLVWFWSGWLLKKHFRQVNSDTGSIVCSIQYAYQSFKIESAQGSSGRTVRPSVRPFQWLARVELVFMSTTGIPDRSSLDRPSTDHSTRKEGRAEILQKPAQGHENFQHTWSSRRLSEMKTFKHESHVDPTRWPHVLTSHVDLACWPHESHVTWWPISKKATLLPEDHPARRTSS